jgi:lipoyl(octanoyl) transferase
MAIEEAVLRYVGRGESPPTIRFFGWSPPCVSLGYGQRAQDELDIGACTRLGYSWLRRPTGGRAILHMDEVTYSLAMPLSDPRAWGGILGSYQRISRGLVLGLESMGAAVDRSEPGPTQAAVSAACFDQPSSYEITYRGRKLVGSAQVRRRNGMLQHGSMPVRGEVDGIVEVLLLGPERRSDLSRRLRERATTLESVLGILVDPASVVKAISRGLADALDVELVEGALSASEQQWASTVGLAKYHDESWNLQGRWRSAPLEDSD